MFNFLALPKEIRDEIYNRVLVLRHPLYFFQGPGSRVEAFAPDRPIRWLSLLYTNRQISHEASATLYKKNHFQLDDITKQRQLDLVRSFLDCIGPVNTVSLSYLCINFPVFESAGGQSGEVRLSDESLQTLKLFQDKCTGLSAMETLVCDNKDSSIFTKTDSLLREALRQIDAQFKAIPSLEKVIVRVMVSDKVPTTSTKDFMQELGWVVISGDGNHS